MGDTITTIIAIFLAAVLMFIFPLMTLSDRTDNISQIAIQTATTEYVDNIRATGVITLSGCDQFEQEISATGNSFDIEYEIQVLDENVGKKGAQVETTKIGENVYYSIYTTQLYELLNSQGNDKLAKLALKEGDIVSVKVKNTNTTMAQQLKNFFFVVAGNDTYQMAASSSGIVSVNGN